jgi:hypothetical protein
MGPLDPGPPYESPSEDDPTVGDELDELALELSAVLIGGPLSHPDNPVEPLVYLGAFGLEITASETAWPHRSLAPWKPPFGLDERLRQPSRR